jgi:hypothetical protein
MNLKELFVVTGCTLFVLSCGENSSRNESKDNSDTVVTNPPAENRPVNTSVDVPEATRASFQAKYPRATNVTWKRYEPVDWLDWSWTGWPSMDTSDYVVNYTDDGVEYWAWYDERNNWIGTSSEIRDHSSLPAPVANAVNKTFPGYTIKSVRRENDKDRTAYEIKLEKGSDRAKLLVDENGKVMKKKTGDS